MIHKKILIISLVLMYIMTSVYSQNSESELYEFYIACARNDKSSIESYLKKYPQNINKELPVLEDTYGISYQKYANWLISEKQLTFENKEEEKNFISNYKRYPINIISRYGDEKTLSILIKNGANIESINENGDTPLIEAIYYDNFKTIAYLLKNGANVNASNNIGETPLIIASAKTNERIFNEVIKYNVDYNTVSNTGATCLFGAIESNNINIMKKVIEAGVDINQMLNNGVTPLYLAVERQNLAQVKLLLNNKANPNICDNEGVSPLLVASIKNSVEIVKELLKFGANVDSKTNYGSTPLIEASYYGCIDTVKLLLKANADINYISPESSTALNCAIVSGNLKLVKLLIENGANLNLVDASMHSSLFYTSQNHNKEINLYLIEKEVGLYTDVIATDLMFVIFDSIINEPEIAYNILKDKKYYREIVNPRTDFLKSTITIDGHQYTIFSLACAHGYKNIVELLLDDIDINYSPNGGKTPLEEAIINEKYEIAIFLLESKKEISNFGLSMSYAYIKKNIIITEKLLNAGAEQDYHPENNNQIQIPLILMAIKENVPEFVEIFAKYGADINYELPETPNGKLNLLFYSIMEKVDNRIINILLEYGADMDFKVTELFSVYDYVNAFVNEGLLSKSVLDILNLYR